MAGLTLMEISHRPCGSELLYLAYNDNDTGRNDINRH
jgi:hypothetical protein